MHEYRTHTCGELRSVNQHESVRLSGWVHRIRDHGGLLFIDLRDHYGITQCVTDSQTDIFDKVAQARSEWVLKIDGVVTMRDDSTRNDKLPTGEVEVVIGDIEILSQADELPFPIFGEHEYPEELRLKYRFIDLRRQKLHHNIVKRSEIIANIRQRMTAKGFTELQTPILTASSPEGARDFLVPSRLAPGKFYALPQAPQQFKQLAMVAGFDRYFQIAPCFRDEAARADRSPGEFYQLDIEMSFVNQEDVFNTIEPVLKGVFEQFGDGKPVNQTFPRISYNDAISKYGTDKPDLRNPLIMKKVSDYFVNSGFKIFSNLLAKNDKAQITAIPAPGGGSRAFCDRMNKWAQQKDQPGMAYIFIRDNEPAGPVAKNLGSERSRQLLDELNLNNGDAVFFVAGEPEQTRAFAAEARNHVASELNLIDHDRFEFCWIVDFPMYEWDEENNKIEFSHNPFSMPQGGMEALEQHDPLTIMAYQYDIVCNGFELSSGAIRNHRPDIMKKAFAIAGYDEDVLLTKFGAMYRAFQYGAPPHGGIAPGIDRMVMLLCGEHNLREVTMFPMNQQAQDLMMMAPSEVTPEHLNELHLKIIQAKD